MNPRYIVPLILTALGLSPLTVTHMATAQSDMPDITPEYFPSVTPLPARSPSPPPVPTATPQPPVFPSVNPSMIPDPRMTRPPELIEKLNQKTELRFSVPSITEGQNFQLTLDPQGNVNYPIKGQVVYKDYDYKRHKEHEEKVAFTLTGPEPQKVELHFRTPGKKTFRIETENNVLPARNVLAYVKPFEATVFPKPVQRDWSSSAKDWQVLVNLHHSASQRQYYQIIHKGEIVQRLLTSSATANKITPLGKFKLGIKAASPKSTLYESVMPFWTTIKIPGHSFEYGNHGLTGESYLYYLGRPASHGCLRLSNKYVKENGDWVNIGGAKWVYDHVPVGSSIQIFRQAVQPFAFENYRSWVAQARK